MARLLPMIKGFWDIMVRRLWDSASKVQDGECKQREGHRVH